MSCNECEMCLNCYPIRVTAKTPNELIKYLKGSEKIKFDQSINGQVEWYVWTDGYKCLYNGEKSLEKKELPRKGKCRMKRR